MSTTILIADDHQILRQGLKLLLEKNSDRKIIAEARDGTEAVKMAIENKPDVVIMDINMPNTDGICATKQISCQLPETKIIALSMHQKKRYISDVLQAGASAYVLKEKAFSELDNALKAVFEGKTYLCPMTSKVVLEDYVNSNKIFEAPAENQLDERDIEIIKYLCEGFSAKEIGAKLGVSSKTIDANRRKIMKKLNIDNLPDLVKFAIREGYTFLE